MRVRSANGRAGLPGAGCLADGRRRRAMHSYVVFGRSSTWRTRLKVSWGKLVHFKTPRVKSSTTRTSSIITRNDRKLTLDDLVKSDAVLKCENGGLNFRSRVQNFKMMQLSYVDTIERLRSWAVECECVRKRTSSSLRTCARFERDRMLLSSFY